MTPPLTVPLTQLIVTSYGYPLLFSLLGRMSYISMAPQECNRICIGALTDCALEMKRSMYHVIPQVLLNFSKISATKMTASPMLEFLSTLIRLPDIFSSFTDTNYMSVFAIALPFTNPFKFDAYIVSMAHHILIMWFLKCRLSYRQNFVQFIVTGLNSNLRHAPSTSAIALQGEPNDSMKCAWTY